MRVVRRRCRCVVQRLCATDIKRPCLVRAAAPHSAPAWMPGVYAQGLCKDAKPTKHTQPFTGKGGSSAWMPKLGHTKLCTRQSHQSVLKGIGIINQKFISKTDFFSKLNLYISVCRKNNIFLKWGLGRSPKVGRRDASPRIHPLSGERGQFGMDAEIRTHQALHEAKPSECPKGDRDNKSEVYFKNRFFQQTEFIYL